MRDYGKVYSRIWESTDFRALSEDGRTLALYLLTCQHGTIAGVFRVPDGYACEDLQWTAERVSEGFANLHAKGFATRCEASKWVWVTKFLEWNPPENPNQRKAAAKVVQSIPDGCAWKPDFMRVSGPSLGLEPPSDFPPPANPSETVGEGFLNQKQEQEQEQKQEQKQHQEQEHSAIAGGKPPALPPDPVKQEIWDAGRSLLLAARMPQKQVGTFLGKLVQDYTAPTVLDAVRAAVKEQPADPAEYLKACCMRATGQRAAAGPINRQQALEDRNRRVASDWAQEGVPRVPH